MRLCGLSEKDAFIHTSYLHFSGFADNAASKWNENLCELVGLDVRKLPRIVKPNETIGEISAEGSALCRLKPAAPVIEGCGDIAANILSCGALEPGICVDVAGTASVFAMTALDFRLDLKDGMLACLQSAAPGL